MNMNSFTLLAIPLFMCAGLIMNVGRITDRIFDFAYIAVGRIPGGLGHVNVLASLIFAGMSGSVLADVAGLGPMELKAMRDKGYDLNFSIGITRLPSPRTDFPTKHNHGAFWCSRRGLNYWSFPRWYLPSICDCRSVNGLRLYHWQTPSLLYDAMGGMAGVLACLSYRLSVLRQSLLLSE